MACERFWLMCRWNKMVALTFWACGHDTGAKAPNVFHVKQHSVHVSRYVAECLVSMVHVDHPSSPSRSVQPTLQRIIMFHVKP